MVRVEDGAIIEARILIDGSARAGAILEARLKSSGAQAIATADGAEYLLPGGAPGVTEGAALRIEVTREAIPGPEPWKRPLARVAGEGGGAAAAADEDCRPLPFPSPDDRLAALGWHDLLEEARSSIVRFPGGELRLFVTPAMTLIDVDGAMAAAELAVAGARAAAIAIRRHGVGGSIGIDLPTVQGKERRNAMGEALDAQLSGPFERTAVNGFGFVQIVRPRRHASLFELAADGAAFEARALLRLAATQSPGARTLVAHPAVIAVLAARAHWLAELGRQIGGAVGLRADPTLAIAAGHAEQA